jgi:hypothetical protein
MRLDCGGFSTAFGGMANPHADEFNRYQFEPKTPVSPSSISSLFVSPRPTAALKTHESKRSARFGTSGNGEPKVRYCLVSGAARSQNGFAPGGAPFSPALPRSATKSKIGFCYGVQVF